jgi:phosphate transport system permease protein
MSATSTSGLLVPPVTLTGEAKLAEYARAKARRVRREKLIRFVLLMAACVSVFTTLGIVYVLVKESIVFFEQVPRSGRS